MHLNPVDFEGFHQMKDSFQAQFPLIQGPNMSQFATWIKFNYNFYNEN